MLIPSKKCPVLREIIHAIVIICSIIILFPSCDTSRSMTPGDERVVVRFINPTSDIVKEFRTTKHNVAAYKPGVYLDIVTTKSKFKDLQSKGYNVKITQTEERLKKNLKLKSLELGPPKTLNSLNKKGKN